MSLHETRCRNAVVAGYLLRHRRLRIGHETIYRYIWADEREGGTLYTHLRGAQKRRRGHSRSYDSRGRVAAKRPIAQPPWKRGSGRPLGSRHRLGPGRPCILSLVERKTGYVVIGKLRARTTAEVNRRATQLLRRQPRAVRTITADNGTEFHGYAVIEAGDPRSL